MNLVSGLIGFVLIGALISPAATFGADDVEQQVIGVHPLTLQWLGELGDPERHAGTASIYRKDGELLIEGSQITHGGDNSGSMEIHGKIVVINERVLQFEGEIVTQVQSINGGRPYTRKGRFILKAWGKRQYWRMQNMTEPDGSGLVTDYIDIFRWTIASPQADSAQSAGFDCTRARTHVETMICHDQALSKLDFEMNALFRQIEDAGGGIADAASEPTSDESNAQKQWLEEVRDRCEDKACLTAAYTARISAMHKDLAALAR